MRVLFISNLYPPFFLGGYEVACQDIADEFRRKGNNTSVLTSSYGIDHPSEKNSIYRKLVVKTDFNGYKSLSEKTLSLFYNPKNYKISMELIKEIKPEIVSVWSISGISVSPIFALQKSKIPYVVHLFDRSLSFLKKHGWKRIMNVIIFNRLKFEHIISCSESLRSDYVKCGFIPDSITVIPHGITPEETFEERKNIDLKQLNLLFVGQLWEAKGVDLAIRCLPLLRRNKIIANLSIIGNGREKYKEYLRKIAEECDVKNRVRFIGRVPREQLKNYYKTHDILLFPTQSWYKEPFGIVILEAMNQGIPVIASRCGGPSEIITDGENGFLFTPGDVKSLTEKIKKLTRSPNLFKKVGESAFKTISSDFNIKHIGRRTIEFYRSIINTV